MFILYSTSLCLSATGVLRFLLDQVHSSWLQTQDTRYTHPSPFPSSLTPLVAQVWGSPVRGAVPYPPLTKTSFWTRSYSQTQNHDHF